MDLFFRFAEDSPFKRDTSIHYDGIKWFAPNTDFYYQSKLYRYRTPETVSVYGTKGEKRQQVKYGYFLLNTVGSICTLNVYKNVVTPSDQGDVDSNYIATWFTDETTGKETYDVGRYVDVGDERPDSNAMYTINLNNAYNPYCAYSSGYSCAIPRKEDHLTFPVLAGEKKYHE